MDLRQLQTFVAVAELKHFARAAGRCNLSQPAVSHQVAQLEKEIGARLFNRTGRRISMTVAGEVLLEEARRILAAVDRAKERLQEVTSGAIGRIRLGATHTAGLYLLPSLLAGYRARHPAYDLQLQVGASHRICEQVARNDLDMAVIGDRPPTADLRAQLLASDDLVLIAAPSSLLAGRRRLKGAQLAAECWVLREDGSESRRLALAWLHRHRIAPARTATFDGPDAVKRAVIACLGIALVSRITVEDELRARSLVLLAPEAALPSRSFYVVDHPQKHHAAACRAMLARFEEAFGGDRGTKAAERLRKRRGSTRRGE